MIASAYLQVNLIPARLGRFDSQSWSEHLAAVGAARR
jgi:hypothetical protein